MQGDKRGAERLRKSPRLRWKRTGGEAADSDRREGAKKEEKGDAEKGKIKDGTGQKKGPKNKADRQTRQTDWQTGRLTDRQRQTDSRCTGKTAWQIQKHRYTERRTDKQSWKKRASYDDKSKNGSRNRKELDD